MKIKELHEALYRAGEANTPVYVQTPDGELHEIEDVERDKFDSTVVVITVKTEVADV